MHDFTYDSDTTLGRLREKISDTDRDDALFTDTELTNILAQMNDSLDLAAAEALGRLKSRPQDLERMFAATSLEDYSEWVDALESMIEQLRSQNVVQPTTTTWNRKRRDTYQEIVNRKW